VPRDERSPRLAGDVSRRSTMERLPRPAEGDGPDERLLRLLSDGDLEILGLLPRSSNYTFLGKVSRDDEETLGVYKPRAGETPLWDFPEGTLCGREVAAFVVARALGWPNVPHTVLRDGPEGVGSLQRFVEFDPSEHYFTLREGRDDVFQRIALFDVVVNNADRKGGHTLLAKDGEIFVIDHGVCFSPEPKLRTVIWDFAGSPIPEELLRDLRTLVPRLSGDVGATLAGLLQPPEIGAVAKRSELVIAAGRFPEPASERAYPWPPV
jgi:uncharacterized repeat protein (TIGR03843 family)